MRREIESYIRWSHRDGGLNSRNHIPVLAISTATTGQSTQDVVDALTARLQHLAGLYRAKWRIHPTVEGSGGKGDKGKGKAKETDQEKAEATDKGNAEATDKGEAKETDKGKVKETETPKEKEKEKDKGKGKEKEKEKKDEFEHELPTLYGIVIAHSIVSLVTLNAAEPDKPVRSIALFDLSDDDHDVWNAFAIAIVVILARNYLVSVRQFDGAGTGQPAAQNDPDA